MIELCDVTKVFRDPRGRQHVAVRRLSLRVEQGRTCCLIGTSGCGKTTTLRLINRLLEPTEGEIRVGGVDVRSTDVIRLRRSLGYVIQRGGLFPHLTVRRNVSLLCELEGWSSDKANRRVDELLELVHMPAAEFGSRYPGELSGGERQRVGVARALALDPDYLLMDEPFGALDPITRAQLQHDFLELQRQVKKTVVLVTHDMFEAFRLGDRIGLMDAGELVQEGSPSDLRERPANDFVADFVEAQVGGATADQGADHG